MRRLTALLLILSAFFTARIDALAMADSADCACIIDALTGEVVFSKNIGKRHPMASTTKIMTAIIALENSSLDDIVTVSANAANVEGSAMYVEDGMQIYMRDLLYGLMLSSGNDAAVAIAEHVAGSVDAFVDMMNLKAQEIGAENTNFTNPNGLPDDAHFTTAGNLAFIARYAMKNPEFREIVGTYFYEARPLNAETVFQFYNHNKLLEWYEGATGVKTGYTDAAGRCLVSSAIRNNMEFIAVTLGDNEDWTDHAEMLDYAFASHYPKKVIENGMTVKVARVDGKEYNMIAGDDFIVPFKENGRCEVELVTHVASDLRTPINAGEKIGYLEIRSGGEEIGDVDIVSEQEITGVSAMRLRSSFISCFMRVVKRILV